MTAHPARTTLDDALELDGPDPRALAEQYERSLVQCLLWHDDDGEMLRAVEGLVEPEDFARAELGELYRWRRAQVRKTGVPDTALLVERLHQRAAERPDLADRLREMIQSVVWLQGRVDGIPSRAVHYAQQVRVRAVLRGLEAVALQRAQELRYEERTAEALSALLERHREAELELLGKL